MSKPRIIFAGTPDFAAINLAALLAANYQIVAVYTQPDRRAGRGKKLQPSPVKQLAVEHNIPVEQPLNFKDSSSIEKLAFYKADLMIVIAYGLLLPKSALDTPKLGCINVHASLLPRWRGAAPIQRAIEAGDKQTGVGIMQMDEGLDTGPVWQSASIDISPDETGASLHDKLASLGSDTLLSTLPTILARSQQPDAQSEHDVTYAHKLQKSEAHIDWSQPAINIERKVRAFNSWPVSFFKIEGVVIRVWQVEITDNPKRKAPSIVLDVSKEGIVVACGEGALILKELQPAGSRRMPVADLLNSKSHWFLVNVPLNDFDHD
ncbi:MAG: methionyl-tRNA formyltransferase [Kangiellaceae bacterium]|jgi:methionyl-tRNA formyltransferase|nr:methionyl-tRNA formyltransferase [Kangiellaceae bacterium]